MKLPMDPNKKESVDSFKEWWQHRIMDRHGKAYQMPDFFEIWDTRQKEIDDLKRQVVDLQNKIRSLGG
jgi:polyhydroxyalkanoate synthesis regulator phasin